MPSKRNDDERAHAHDEGVRDRIVALSACDHVIVLAAGRGSRMGGPKALMNVGGHPWWHVQAERLVAVGLPVTWVVSEEVARAIEAARPRPALSLVRADPDAPMFESLMTGLRANAAAGPRGVFVLPVDVPAPLIEVWRALAGSITPAVPEFERRRGHPVYLPWGWVEKRLLEAPTTEKRRLDVLIRDDVRAVGVNDGTVTINLNTLADVRAWLRSLAK